MVYGILIKGKKTVKCSVCNGEGYVNRDNSFRTCPVCKGKGFIDKATRAEKVLHRFGQPKVYSVKRENGAVLLEYRGYYWSEIIRALEALKVSNVKAEIVFPI